MALMASIFCLNTATATEISFTEGTNFALSLSPDGTTFAMDLQGIMWTLPVGGGEATKMTYGQQPEVREPSWSPNGKQIAFQGFYRGYFHIWIINVADKKLTQITTGDFDDREPSWNAKGNSIVFASDRSGNYDIWQIDLKTKALSQITTHKDDDAHPQRSPDGKRLLFTREIKGQYSEIILQQEGKEVSLFRGTDTSFFRPSWNIDNLGFSYISHNDNQIKLNYIADVDSRLAQANETVLAQGDIFPFKTIWTPLGAYFSADGQIKFIDALEHKTSTIAFKASINSVTPNYKQKKRNFNLKESIPVLGIGSMDISIKDNAMVFSALGDMWLQQGYEKPINISNDIGHILDPTWSKNGDYLAYVAEHNGQMDIWVRQMKSGTDKQMTNDKNREYRLAWSPDGRSIAFLSTRSISNTWGRADLKILDVDFGSTNVIEERIFTPGRPQWSPDGKNLLLAYVKPATSRFREGMHGIKQINIQSGKSKFLDLPHNIGLSTRDGSGPVISPDGQKMAYISEGEIRAVMINDAGEITKSIDNKCLDTAQMPRWGNNSTVLYYLSGKSFKSCDIGSGKKINHKIDLSWRRARAFNKTIHVGKFFDGLANQYKENVDIFIAENRILKIKPHGQDKVIGTLIDYSDKTIIPGIMAAHSHQSELMGERLGRNWLAYGVTSVRDPGSNPYKSLMRKETWDSGKSMGPRMFHGGWLTGGARIYYGQSYNALNEKALRHELQRARELDYDLLKSYVRLPDEYQQILVKEGHNLGIPITSHEISPAVQNGMDAVEHMGATSRRGYSPKYSSLSKSYNDVMEIISKSGLMITPTATLMSGFDVYNARYPQYMDQMRSKIFLDQKQRDGLKTQLENSWARDEAENNPSVLQSIKTLHDMGANITAGTDSPFIPYGIAELFEIVMFVDAGLTPYDALRAGTVNVAKLIGVQKDLGTLEVGKLADLVVIDGDPLNKITDIFNVVATMKDGFLYKQEDLIIDRGEK